MMSSSTPDVFDTRASTARRRVHARAADEGASHDQAVRVDESRRFSQERQASLREGWALQWRGAMTRTCTLALDVGGTFTDITLPGPATRPTRGAKTPPTPQGPPPPLLPPPPQAP